MGGGPTGCEIAANVCALLDRLGASADVTIIAGSSRLVQRYRSPASRALTRLLTRRGINIMLEDRVERVETAEIVSANGQSSSNLP